MNKFRPVPDWESGNFSKRFLAPGFDSAGKRGILKSICSLPPPQRSVGTYDTLSGGADSAVAAAL